MSPAQSGFWGRNHRAALRATEIAVILSSYLNLLVIARAHSATTSDVDLNKFAVAAGLCTVEDGRVVAPYLGEKFGLAVVTTDMELAPDLPLAPGSEQPWFKTKGLAWWLGSGSSKSALNRDPYARRDYVSGGYPFETLKRVDKPTTFIDEERVARVPKRADMFARAQFGDLGPKAQAASGWWLVRQKMRPFLRPTPHAERFRPASRRRASKSGGETDRSRAQCGQCEGWVTFWASMLLAFPGARTGSGTVTTPPVPN